MLRIFSLNWMHGSFSDINTLEDCMVATIFLMDKRFRDYGVNWICHELFNDASDRMPRYLLFLVTLLPCPHLSEFKISDFRVFGKASLSLKRSLVLKFSKAVLF